MRRRRGFAEKRLFLASCQDRRFLVLLRLTYATRVSVRDAGSTILRVDERRICLGAQPPRLFQDVCWSGITRQTLEGGPASARSFLQAAWPWKRSNLCVGVLEALQD